jgi:two-component system cell cycle sensor histidine kinase/response regulator CckA
MLYIWVSSAYSIVNLCLALLILARSRQNVLSRFYGFCVFSLLALGVCSYMLGQSVSPGLALFLRLTTAFLYSVFPFFFLHFMLVFVRRYEILRSKKIILANYFAGLFSYAMVLLGLVPVPFSAETGITLAGYIYFLTWMSILFSIGVALMYSLVGGFGEHGMKANILFGAFVVLMLLLPTPFTLSIFSVVAGDTFVWYFLSSTAALTVVVYIVFRHRITMNTPYQAMKAALGAMNDVLLKTNMDLEVEIVHGGVLAALKYTESELRGRRLNELMRAPERLVEFRNALLQGHQGETSFETGFVGSDGSTIPMDFSFTPVFANEEIIGIVGVGRNIAERRRAERLKESAYHIAQAADTAETLEILFRSVHRIVGEVMPAENFYIALFDQKENVLSFPYFVDRIDQIVPARRPGRGLTEYVLRTGQPLLCDGTTFKRLQLEGHVELFGSPSLIWLGVPLVVRGKTIGVMGVQEYDTPNAYGLEELQMLEYVSTQVAQSIDRKQSEEALRVSEENYRRIFEEDLTGDACISSDGRILDCNPAFAKIFGFGSPAEAMGTHIRSLYPDPRSYDAMAALLRKRRKLEYYEEELRRRDGLPVHVIQNIVGQFDDAGRLSEILLYAFDDTERKKLEDQLRQSQKLENLGAMAGGIAHDFNNILTIMSVHLSMIHPGKAPTPKTENCLDAISKAVRRGAGLVNQLLTFARKTDVLFESVNVNHTIGELTRMLEATFPKTVVINFNPEEHLPTIAADPSQLHQAVLNLCVNARDAMPDGGTVTISTRIEEGRALREHFPDAQDDRYVSISVADTGVGMDTATRNRIFEPFFTTKEKGKGTGLGLAVVYGVVRGHHGFIDVTSEPAIGTTFTLYFYAPNRSLTTTETTEKTGDQRPLAANTAILLVEDEDLVRETLKVLFEEQGYMVYAARDGFEAVEVYARSHAAIDIVLTDIGLPRKSGWDAYREMKEINPEVRAIFATGYVDPAVKAEMVKAGAVHFVQKPYVPGQLFDLIETVLEAEKQT